MSYDEMDQKRPKPVGRTGKKKKGDLGSIFQKKIGGSPLWLFLVLGLLLIVGAVIFVSRMGGDKDPPRRRRAARPTPPATPANVNPSNQETQPIATTEGSQDDPTQMEGTSNEEPGSGSKDEQIPLLSEDFAQWKTEDYHRARSEGSPLLIEAVGHLGKKFVGSSKADTAANLLASLLKKPKEPPSTRNPHGSRRPPPRNYHSSGNRGDTNVFQAITEALEVNASPTARNILKTLVAGKQPTEDYKVSAQAALETLARHPSPENEEILYQAITTADQWCRRGEDRLDSEEISTIAFSLAERSASENFRLRLARRLAQPKPAPEDVERFDPFLRQEHPKNVPAQIFLYRSVDFDEQAKTEFEVFFRTSSMKILGLLLEIPEESLIGSASNYQSSTTSRHERTYSRHSSQSIPIDEPFDPNQPYRLAQHLWGNDFSKMLLSRLKEAKTLDESARLVLLGATIPTDAMRSRISRLLQKSWKEGPESLRSEGMASQVFTDPGFLAVVKSLPRKDPVTPRTSTGSRSTTPRAVASRANTQEIEEAWMATSEEMARFLCERFRHAADARAESEQHMDRTSEDGQDDQDDQNDQNDQDEMPIELHSEDSPTAQYQFHWPENVLGKEDLSNVALDPMKIDYVRFEETAKPMGLLGFYRRKVSSPKIHNISDGIWIESFRTTPKTDRKVSIDIFITTKEEPTEEATPNDPIDLIIEILCIEVRDPEVPFSQPN